MTLRELLGGDECVLVPGVYDCVSARIAERAGFRALQISGSAVSSTFLGRPDLGFTSLTEVADVARRIRAVTRAALICDADTGFGGPSQVWETTRRLAAAGVDGLHLEDQVFPKRCGIFAGRQVIPTAEMVAKVEAAVDARRQGADVVILARSDARESGGLEEVVERLNAYFEAGADAAFFGEKYTEEDVRYLTAHLTRPLAICAGIPGWPAAAFRTERTYREWGVRLVFYSFSSLYPAARAMRDFYETMARERGVSEALARDALVPLEWFFGLDELETWERRDASFAEAARPTPP